MTTVETFFRGKWGMREGRVVVERIGGKHPRFEVTVYYFRPHFTGAPVGTVFGIAPTLKAALTKARHNLWSALTEARRNHRGLERRWRARRRS